MKVQDHIRNFDIKVRPQVPFFSSFHFKKFKTKVKHLRRVCFKILLKIYSEMPDFLQWLIDISGQSTSIDCTMSILTFISFQKVERNPIRGKFWQLGFWVGFLVNFIWQYNPRLLTIYNEIPDFVQLQVDISGRIEKLHFWDLW